MKKLPEDFGYLKEMYGDEYFPDFLVDRVRDSIRKVVGFLEEGGRSGEEIQESLDRMVEEINELQDAFYEHDSEIETVARDSIATTVEAILAYFDVDIDVEEALRGRDW